MEDQLRKLFQARKRVPGLLAVPETTDLVTIYLFQARKRVPGLLALSVRTAVTK